MKHSSTYSNQPDSGLARAIPGLRFLTTLPLAHAGLRGPNTGHYWIFANDFDTMYSLFNPTDRAQDFIATIYYGDGSGSYQMPVHLEAQASTMIDMMMLIGERRLDVHGNVIPPTIQQGSIVFESAKGKAQWMTLVVSGGVYNPRRGTCGQICIYCYGYTGPAVAANPFAVAVQATTNLQATATYADGTVYDFTSSSSWSSDTTPVATVGTSTGVVTGQTVGSATISAAFPTLVAYSGQICSMFQPTCPTFAPVPQSPGKVLDITVHFVTKDAGDSIAFPVGYCGQNLGVYGCTYGWFWHVEIKGTVPDDASKWTASQIASGNLHSCETNGSCTDYPFTHNPDATGSVLNTSGTSFVYWLDAPGIKNLDPYLDSATYTANLQSRIKEGTSTACVNWNVKVVLNPGLVLDTTNSTAGITPGPCQ